MAKPVQRRTPRAARTEAQLIALTRDHVTRGDYWMLLDRDRIVLCEQPVGESPTGKVAIPRRTFEAFIDWYNSGEWPPRRAK